MAHHLIVGIILWCGPFSILKGLNLNSPASQCGVREHTHIGQLDGVEHAGRRIIMREEKIHVFDVNVTTSANRAP